MKKKHPLSNQKYKELVELAGTLPKIQRDDNNGTPLFTLKFDRVERKGRVANNIYKKVPLLANHEVSLVEAWKAGGQHGVDYYLNLIKAVEEKTAPKEEPVNNG